MRVPAVGAVVFNGDGWLLLVRRAHSPSRGLWSLPGGHLEPGETPAQGCAREVLEETGLVVTVDEQIGRLDVAGDDVVYDVVDFRCTVVGGELHHGDDAAAVRWVAPEEVTGLPTSPGLVAALTRWGLSGQPETPAPSS